MRETTPRTKILFLLPGLQAGGAERVAITLMNALPRDQYHKSIGVVDASGALRPLIEPDIAFADLAARNVFLALPALYRLWKKEQPDIVFSTLTHMNFATLVLKHFFPRTKVIVREATMPSYFFATYRKLGGLIKAAYRHLYCKAEVIIAPSNLVLNELRALPGMKDYKYRLLYNPVMQHLDTSAARPDDASDNGLIEFISVGRLDTQKGLDALIVALKDTVLPFEWRWKIVGEGPQRQTLQTLITQCGLSENIKLEKFTNNPSGYYKGADALLLPSRWEGMPNVALEALAFGTPVIALKTAGGISEIAVMCAKDTVIVAPDMESFTQNMKNIRPKIINTSLVPAVFTREAVFADFESILRQAQV